jgi:hypothetical protein
MKRYTPDGKNIPIISGEWGYSNVNWDNARLSNERQAQYLTRELLINLYQKIPVSIWYDRKNDGANPNEREHHFGTVMHNLKPKPAYLAAKTLSSTLTGFSIDKRLDLGSDEYFAFKLTKEKAEAVAIWTIGKEHKVMLPVEVGEARIIHFLGKEVKRTASARKNGGLELTISQNPQYLIVKGE